MRISHRHRLILFSNPKTGSSSVRRFIDPFCDVRPVRRYHDRTPDNPFYPHMRPEEARECFERFGWDFGGYARLVCVRNPWARLVSLYHHIRRSDALPPFEDWITTLSHECADDRLRWRKYGVFSLEHFVKDRSGNVLVDRVIRTEDLDRELVPALRALGLPVAADATIPRHNHSGAGSRYVEAYSDRSADLVRDLFRYEVVHFGYEFGDPA